MSDVIVVTSASDTLVVLESQPPLTIEVVSQGPVGPTGDVNPQMQIILAATQAARDAAIAAVDGSVHYNEAQTKTLGDQAQARANIGLDQVDNTSDANKPISTAAQAALNTKENSANKGAPNGYAGLDDSGKVSATQLPSYVDDVLEFANLAAFPGTGEAGKIYVAQDTNKTYRWSGSVYIYITSGSVDSVAGKTGVVALVKGDVGLGNVDNTSDANKPISTATQAALDAIRFDQSGITQGAPFSFRNKIINGSFEVSQRGSSFTVTGSAAYVADCWVMASNVNTYVVYTGGYIGGQALAWNGAAGFTIGWMQQRIEAANVSMLAGSKVTVSGYIYNNVASVRTVTLGLFTPSAVDNHAAQNLVESFSISLAASAWTRFSKTTTAALSAEVTKGLAVQFSTTTLAAAEWLFFDFIQLEAGSIATPFESRPIGFELGLCQRYFYRISNYMGQSSPYDSEATGAKGTSTTTTIVYRVSAQHPVVMRGTPIVTVASVSIWDGVYQRNVTSILNNNSSKYARSMDYNVAAAMGGAGLTATEFVMPTGYIEVSAELT